MQFGIFVPQGWTMDLVDVEGSVAKFETMVRCAQEAEQAGFDSIWLYDHLHTVPQPVTEDVFECWTAMAALARETTRIRLGQMVTCNSYRPPALLAKMASCIDVMSHGRLIVGMGAGWYQHEYEAFGYEYPDVPERLRHLAEALQVLKAMWTEERAFFEGTYYRLGGAINEPKPVQKPHPPLWVGGSGERVTLRLVARYGDAANFGGDVEDRRRKLDVLRRHCEAVGRDYDSIIKSTNVSVVIGDQAEVERIVQMRRRQCGGVEFWERPPAFGTAEQVAAQLRQLIDVGHDYLVLSVPNAFEDGAIQRVAEELLPLLR